MEFKDYYATLGISNQANPAEIKAAYRKQARKFHPDVSKEPDAEARFKDITEANEALNDSERRAAYDAVVARHKGGLGSALPPDWNSGFEFDGRGAGSPTGFSDAAGFARSDTDHSDFFDALFGRQTAGARRTRNVGERAGGDHHAKVQIDLQTAYTGGQRAISLRMPQIDAHGQLTMHARQLEVDIPKGIRGGQHLRLAGQGAPGLGSGPAGDLYLEIEFAPTGPFRVEERDVYVDLPVAPWEAALGAEVTVATPDGSVELTVPANASAGLKLRLRGKGIPGAPAGDLYAVLAIALPKAATPVDREAWHAISRAFSGFQPRQSPEGDRQ